MFLELQLLDAVDAPPIWTKTIDLHCSANHFYPFEDCSIFKKRPFLVSCGKCDPNKAFVPGLMYFILEEYEDEENQEEICSLSVYQNHKNIFRTNKLSEHNFIKFFLINTSGKSLL
jgi:hypothetical protein